MGKSVISFAYAVIWINLFLCSYGKCYSSITNITEDFLRSQTLKHSFMFNKFTMRESHKARLRTEAFSNELLKPERSSRIIWVWARNQTEHIFTHMLIIAHKFIRESYLNDHAIKLNWYYCARNKMKSKFISIM